MNKFDKPASQSNCKTECHGKKKNKAAAHPATSFFTAAQTNHLRLASAVPENLHVFKLINTVFFLLKTRVYAFTNDVLRAIE